MPPQARGLIYSCSGVPYLFDVETPALVVAARPRGPFAALALASSAPPQPDDAKLAEIANGPAADLAPDDAGPSRAAASLSGRVIVVSDAGVAGALVVAADGQRQLRQTRSAETGAFHFDDLAPGEWTVAAKLAPPLRPLGPIPVAPGDDLRDIDLHLVPGVSLSGRVLEPPQPQRHRQRAARGRRLALYADFSGADGRYVFAAMPAGKQQILVQAPGFLPRKVAVNYASGSKAQGLDVFLRAATRIEGMVVDKGGGGVPGASLYLWRYKAAGGDAADLTPLGVQSADDGTFAVDLEAGVVRLIARMSGMAEGQSEQLDLAEGQAGKAFVWRSAWGAR